MLSLFDPKTTFLKLLGARHLDAELCRGRILIAALRAAQWAGAGAAAHDRAPCDGGRADRRFSVDQALVSRLAASLSATSHRLDAVVAVG